MSEEALQTAGDIDFWQQRASRAEAELAAQAKRIENLEYVCNHAAQATALLSARSETYVGQSLPEAVQTLLTALDAARNEAFVSDNARTSARQAHSAIAADVYALRGELDKTEADRDQALAVAAETARDLRLAVMALDTWTHIGAESASALARVWQASDSSANYYELGNRIEDILGELPPAPKTLLALVSAAVDVNDAWQTGAGIDAAATALLAAVAAWQAELET